MRGWLGLAGGGAALGMAAGAARGLLAVHRNGDWRNGTLWLGWFRAAPWLVGLGLAGVAAGLLTALLIRRRPDSRLLALPLVVLAAAVLSLLFQNPLGALRAGSRPSVILVSIDTLRADRLVGAQGARTMPRLHALLGDGTVFAQATSAAPWTLPSHVSLFTSLLPFDHGVRWTPNAISAGRCTLTERFKEAGYRTGAFTGGVYVAAQFGLGQGFEVYEEHDEEKVGGTASIFSGALRWVRRHQGAPFFLFVHTYEAHTPYRGASTLPPGRLATGLPHGGRSRRPERPPGPHGGGAPVRHLAVRRRRARRRRARFRVPGGPPARGNPRRRGPGGALRSRGGPVGPRRHPQPGHGHALYEELVHVPLAVRAPRRVRAGCRSRPP